MKKDGKNLHAEVPDLRDPLRNVLHSTEELEYGLPGVVRLLSRRGRNGKNGYFFEGFRVAFASELDEEVTYEKTFLDHENLEIVIKLPDPADPGHRDKIRRDTLREYTLGADDVKTRAALTAFAGLDAVTKQTLIENEREWAASNKQRERKDGPK